jgi:hypothetical protein
MKFMEKSGAEHNRYPFNMPSYFRQMDNPNYREIKHTNVNGDPLDMIHVVSRNQGWITLEPETMDRKHPIEKKKLGNVKEVNVLSPIWMQVTHKKPDADYLKAVSILGDNRTKANKTILVGKDQPNRSVFKTGVDKVDKHKELMRESIRRVSLTTGRARLLNWRGAHRTEANNTICAKIGSFHFA